ncbi:hypothetical protein [Rhodococcus sp. A14]|uniref:hypothetical protein n=1 Tax=Rhodococcus sp. A14 TaxID=1194106 RepID=UPI0014207001|nr:hypothetical protein [Rhodococcus sp. A14]
MKNQSWIVDRASTGTYDPSCFRLIEDPIPSAPDGKIVVQTLLMSLDPTNLNWLKLDPQLQAIPFGIGDPMIGVSIGVVIESRAPAHTVGDVVTGIWGGDDSTSSIPCSCVPRNLLRKYRLSNNWRSSRTSGAQRPVA